MKKRDAQMEVLLDFYWKLDEGSAFILPQELRLVRVLRRHAHNDLCASASKTKDGPLGLDEHHGRLRQDRLVDVGMELQQKLAIAQFSVLWGVVEFGSGVGGLAFHPVPCITR